MVAVVTDKVEAALFPIPEVVAFPGVTLPLHVFEPRYRQLVGDCIRDDRLLGVSHTRKMIRDAPKNQKDTLNSNQATYQPQDVFCAGICSLVDTTPDGRLLVEVAMRERLVLGHEVQTLPYRIVECERISDLDEPEKAERSRQLQTLVNAKLIAVAGSTNPALLEVLRSESWLAQDPGDFSFKIFQFVRLPPSLMQEMLELRSAAERLAAIWEALSSR